MEDQSRQVLERLRTALEAAGSGLDLVGHLTIYFPEMAVRAVALPAGAPVPRGIRTAGREAHD
jgi:enamine deaminase RidA (YjgF/YER057c/UK114 family)